MVALVACFLLLHLTNICISSKTVSKAGPIKEKGVRTASKGSKGTRLADVSKQTDKAHSHTTVAIPRSKQTKNPLSRLLGQRIVQSIAREIKSSFSSDLEALTLQVKDSLMGGMIIS